MSDEKPTKIFKVTGCDYSGFHPSETGFSVIGLVCEGSVDIALEFSPEALGELEARLARIREAQRQRQKLQ